MAHEITIRENGMAEMAFIGDRSKIWHGLGQELTPGSSIDEWATQAGMDWKAQTAIINYSGKNGVPMFHPDRRVIYRDDTNAALGIVSADFSIVQPIDILEFFRDLTIENGMTLSSAGTLFGGKRFWALADTGKHDEVVEGDEVGGYLLLTTSVDGTLATTAKFTSIRVVCNNTLSISLNSDSKNLIKRTHKKKIDFDGVKLDLGLINSGWDNFMGRLRNLASKKISDTDVKAFYEKKFFNPEKLRDEQAGKSVRLVNDLMERYMYGAGSEFGDGTLWGVLNAVTSRYTHGTGRKDKSYQFWESFYGESEKMKSSVFEELEAQYVCSYSY